MSWKSTSAALLPMMLTLWAAGGCSGSNAGEGAKVTGDAGIGDAGSGDGGNGCVVLFESGFEAPTYTSGAVNGQDKWSGPGVFTVEKLNSHSGGQSLKFNAKSGDFYAVSHPIAADGAKRVFHISVWHYVGMFSNWNGFLVNDQHGNMINQITSNLEGRYAMHRAPTCAMPRPPNCNLAGELLVKPGQWNHVTMTIDFQTMKMRGSVNDASFVTASLDPALPRDTTVASLLLDGFAAGENNFDDVSVTACPAAP